MPMRHTFPVDPYARQLEAIGAGESRVIVLETAAGTIQRGDTLWFGEDAGRLEFSPPSEFLVARIVTGTKGNGILPGFAVAEVIAVPLAETDDAAEPPAAKRGRT